MESYLSNITQYVYNNGNIYKELLVKKKDPQGSRTIFNLYQHRTCVARIEYAVTQLFLTATEKLILLQIA